MWWCQFIDWLKFETRSSSSINFGTAYWKWNSFIGNSDTSSKHLTAKFGLMKSILYKAWSQVVQIYTAITTALTMILWFCEGRVELKLLKRKNGEDSISCSNIHHSTSNEFLLISIHFIGRSTIGQREHSWNTDLLHFCVLGWLSSSATPRVSLSCVCYCPGLTSTVFLWACLSSKKNFVAKFYVKNLYRYCGLIL